MKQLTRDLRRRLCHPEWARRIDDPVHEELQAIADHRQALDAPEETHQHVLTECVTNRRLS